MSLHGRSLLTIDTLEKQEIDGLFQKAKIFKNRIPQLITNKVVALLFFEPSTRTALSFQMAAYRLGYSVLDFDSETSSMTKGESLYHTIKTVQAMGPDLFIIRHGTDISLEEIAPHFESPIVNGGEGANSHPTQALLDAFTILEERGKLEGENVLIAGDVAHSRVARSNVRLLSKMGANIGICAPEEWYSSDFDQYGVTRFESVGEGIKWATCCMALRIQRERHQENENLDQWVSKNQFSVEKFKSWREDGVILHPGPFNVGVEIQSELLEDSRSKIFDQKANGVFMRAAIMYSILEEII